MPDISSACRHRKQQNSKVHECVEDHFEEVEQVYDDRFTAKYGFFRAYVKQVIYRYLDCGMLHNGFVRVKCTSLRTGREVDDCTGRSIANS